MDLVDLKEFRRRRAIISRKLRHLIEEVFQLNKNENYKFYAGERADYLNQKINFICSYSDIIIINHKRDLFSNSKDLREQDINNQKMVTEEDLKAISPADFMRIGNEFIDLFFNVKFGDEEQTKLLLFSQFAIAKDISELSWAFDDFAKVIRRHNPTEEEIKTKQLMENIAGFASDGGNSVSNQSNQSA